MATSAAISVLTTVATTVSNSLAPNASELSEAVFDLGLFIIAMSAFGIFLLEVKRFYKDRT